MMGSVWTSFWILCWHLTDLVLLIVVIFVFGVGTIYGIQGPCCCGQGKVTGGDYSNICLIHIHILIE